MTLWLAVAAFVLSLAPGLDDPPEIMHEGVECVLAERFPRIEAQIKATKGVARARVLFRRAGADEWYEVAMKPEGGAWVGVLPQPKRTLEAFDYYIVVIDAAMGMSQTPEFHPFVVSDAGGCQGKTVTGALTAAAVHLQAPVGAPIVPAGFAGRGVTGGGVAGGSTAGASSKGLVVALIGGGAAAGLAVAKGGGGESGSSSTPASATPSPSAPPASTPSPTPAPTPTPPPVTGNLGGRWVGTGSFSPDPTYCTWSFGLTVDLTQTGMSLSGTAVFTTMSSSGNAGCEPVGTALTAPISGSVNGSNVILTSSPEADHVVTLAGTPSGNSMSGTVQDQKHGRTRNGAWTAARQ